ncbi:hypothetical protein GMMP1_1600001 [Candidatus Magnetomoraceae bacterium gMMP-1]
MLNNKGRIDLFNILYRDGKITILDENELITRAKKAALRLHRRFYG